MGPIGEYIRTALLIDDRIDEQESAPEDLETEEKDQVAEEPRAGLYVPDANGDTPVYWRSLVEAFLEQNVVCSVIEAKEDLNIVDVASRGAEIADLLILDWVLSEEDRKALCAIKRIAEEQGDRLRVIAVFTGQRNLGSVSSRLQSAAGFEPLDQPRGRFSDCILLRGHTIVLLFNKPSVRSGVGYESRRAEYSELPLKIRNDLESVFDGLMPRFAFRTVNVLRESVTRVLTRFGAELDAAALTHRALLPQPVDAGPQFIRLIISEFEEALIEAAVDDVWYTESVREFLSTTTLLAETKDLEGTLRRSPKTPSDVLKLESRDAVIEAIARGLYEMGMEAGKVRDRASEVSGVFGDSRLSEERLAALMSGSEFGTEPPCLELGVVLEDLQSGTYLLCIQPVCDSVRLTEAQAFPFMPLRQEPSGPPAAIIRDGEGNASKVGFESKPHKLVMREFCPDESGRVVATSSRSEPAGWVFVTKNRNHTYRALARLRSEVAVQAVQQFVTKASRPGVDTFELLRLGKM